MVVVVVVAVVALLTTSGRDGGRVFAFAAVELQRGRWEVAHQWVGSVAPAAVKSSVPNSNS